MLLLPIQSELLPVEEGAFVYKREVGGTSEGDCGWVGAGEGFNIYILIYALSIFVNKQELSFHPYP